MLTIAMACSPCACEALQQRNVRGDASDLATASPVPASPVPTSETEVADSCASTLQLDDYDIDAAVPNGTSSVVLPPPPKFRSEAVAARYPDGAYSVAGLRIDLDARFKESAAGQTVIVHAWVQDIYVPQKCPNKRECPPPGPQHLWVTDDPQQRGRAAALMVFDYYRPVPRWEQKVWERYPEVKLEKGKRYTFKAQLVPETDLAPHLQSPHGLLKFIAYKPFAADNGGSWVYPRGAPWHPWEIEKAKDLEFRWGLSRSDER